MPKLIVITLFAFAVTLGTACGDPEPATTASPTATPTPTSGVVATEERTPTATATPIPTPASVEFASDIVEFVLQDLTIEVGTSVLWTNRDISSHTSTSGRPGDLTGIWDSRVLSTGKSYSFTFNQTGTFPYFCEIHPFMQATVTVVASLPGGPIASTPPVTPTHESMAMEEPTPTPTPEAKAMEDATPTPTHEPMVMETPTPTPTNGAIAVEDTPTPTPEAKAAEITPTPESTRPGPAVQEFAIIENYAATRFFPKEIVVIKGVPVKLYLTRLHREHVNKFSISPFYSSSQVILPGQVGLIEFLPDQLGKFQISNVGHGFDATLVVVETMEDVRQHYLNKGVKMFALIQSESASRVYPEISFVVKDVPVKVFNISLTEEYKVSIEPFHVAEDINVMPREISSFDFTPDRTGEFTIRSENHEFTGTLIVEDGG